MHRLSTVILLALFVFLIGGCAGSMKVKSYAPSPENGDKISGTIVKPDGDGPFPAVIILHGCSGIYDNYYVWANRLKEWGYASLVLNSTRGITDCRSKRRTSTLDRALDAHAAKVQFGDMPFVDRNRIGVLGFSAGGSGVLDAIRFNLTEYSLPDVAKDPFKAAIAFYPSCNRQVDSNTNLLILIGDKDQALGASACELNLPKAHDQKSEIVLKVYPDTYHAFDFHMIDTVSTWKGIRSKYNQAATEDAISRVKAFFDKYL
ncbi:MAG: dienelactone hydrolase family protein [Deltaproteobacteria bacterium]|jgi:dienelactone hydrolase|nr:dienelactone hydrolase family protein [Deltaproteobacteria bacterium]